MEAFSSTKGTIPLENGSLLEKAKLPSNNFGFCPRLFYDPQNEQTLHLHMFKYST